jgi:predicted nucleic acid-binding protein
VPCAISRAAFDSAAFRVALADVIELEGGGTPFGPYDLLIAAHSPTLELTLVRANRAEFDSVAGLRLESWR